MAKPKAKKLAGKKKIWVRIHGPDLFENDLLGESYVYEPKSLLGKTITINLGNFLGDPKKQTINVNFKITKLLDEGKVGSELIGLKMSPASIKRMVRRNKEKIDDSFICTSKDNKKVLIKPVAITRGKTHHSVLTKIRLTSRDYISKSLKKTKFEDFMKDVMLRKFQRGLFDALKKIYPLSMCDFKWIKIVGEEAVKPESEAEAKEEPKEEKAKPEEKQETPKESEKPVVKEESKPQEVKAA